MALVAYDYESGSENEEEEENTASVIIPKIDQITNRNSNKTEATLEQSNPEDASLISKLFSDLPKTKSHTNEVVEDKLEDFIPKYQPAPKEKREKVKITIPSLSQFTDDDDEPVQKKTKTASKSCSLLSLLPPVRGSPLTNTSFIPKVLKNKPVDNRPSTSNLVPNNVRRKAELAKKAAIEKITKLSTSSGAESDDDVELPESFDEEMWKKVCGRPKPKRKEVRKQVEPPAPVAEFNIAPDPEEPYDGLDNAAFKALVGKSKMPVNIKLIDINEEEVLSDKDMWMTKSLTDPDNYPKPEIEEPVDPTRKKKHHITYLAEQAKANEQEFKSQWAASKHTRTQTRAKYGF